MQSDWPLQVETWLLQLNVLLPVGVEAAFCHLAFEHLWVYNFQPVMTTKYFVFLLGSCSNFCVFWWQPLAYMLANSMLVHVSMTCECVCIMCFCVCVGDGVLEGTTAETGGSMKEWIGLSCIPLQALPMLRHCFNSPGYRGTVAKKIKLTDSWHIVFFFFFRKACYVI